MKLGQIYIVETKSNCSCVLCGHPMLKGYTVARFASQHSRKSTITLCGFCVHNLYLSYKKGGGNGKAKNMLAEEMPLLRKHG